MLDQITDLIGKYLTRVRAQVGMTRQIVGRDDGGAVPVVVIVYIKVRNGAQ